LVKKIASLVHFQCNIQDKIIFICEQDKTSSPPEGDVTDNDISLQAEENLRDYENIFQLKDVGVHLIYQ